MISPASYLGAEDLEQGVFEHNNWTIGQASSSESGVFAWSNQWEWN